ncbi:outer membrane beta-barrel protein [Litoribacter populi]|uniref:outer membrane beta-barrel protein n=1 Tax=Litoribacter populi TaxID=2598460 RepID=UPI0011817358|nr:outer membrane beta-barrel protein [Litoribacter populi]
MRLNLKMLAMVIMAFASSKLMAQDTYLQIGGGFALPTSSSAIGDITTLGPDGVPTSIEAVNNKLGGGIPITVRAGYMITPNVGADIGLNYLIGNKVPISEFRVGGDVLAVSGHTRQARINPAIVFSTGSDQILSAYSRLGLVLPVGGVTSLEYRVPASLSTSGNSVLEVEEVRGQFTVGFSGTLGAEYEVYDRLKIFGELEAIHLAVPRRVSETVTFRVGGQDGLDALPTYSRETNYVTELTPSSNNAEFNPNVDQNRPMDELVTTTFFNSIGMNVGLRYRLF